MNQEIIQCQSCKADFVIAPEDFEFYERIKVPPPTWCPECRFKRRLLWRNEYILSRRQCDAPGHGEQLITIFHKDGPVKRVFDSKYWWGDEWDAIDYGKEYDFSRPFFGQVYELVKNVPRPQLCTNYASMVRSDYSNWAGNIKDSYLITDADTIENSAYGSGVFESRECYDCDATSHSELCYDCYNIEQCYATIASVNCHECAHVFFSKGLVGCSSCFGCINLRKKSYCVFNIQHTKEEYEEKVAELFNRSFSSYETCKNQARNFWLKNPHKSLRGLHNLNSFGDYLYHTKNVRYGYFVNYAEDSKYVSLLHSPGTKDCYDYTDWGENAELLYECVSCGYGASNMKFCSLVVKNVHDVQYSHYCWNCSYLFGCVGLRNKQYCILNKQYTKEEYEMLVPKVIEHMNTMPYTDAKGRIYRYGEFFPFELAPFAYNEAVTDEYFQLTKEEAEQGGILWREEQMRAYTSTIKNNSIPETSSSVGEEILKEVLECAHGGSCKHQCTTAFKLIPQELEFYKKMNLPLPRLCPRCRHRERLKNRNSSRLLKRVCDCAGSESKSNAYKNTQAHAHGSSACGKEIQTSYSTESPVIVYCEECFQNEFS